jgi:hypothetical protein
MRITKIACTAIVAATVIALTTPYAAAYCLTGVRWTSQADVRYNSSGKVTSGQCISSSQLDSAVTGGIGSVELDPLRRHDERQGESARRPEHRSGGPISEAARSGVTNYLSYSNQANTCCGSNCFRELFEADVRITTALPLDFGRRSVSLRGRLGFLSERRLDA